MNKEYVLKKQVGPRCYRNNVKTGGIDCQSCEKFKGFERDGKRIKCLTKLT